MTAKKKICNSKDDDDDDDDDDKDEDEDNFLVTYS